MKQYIIPENLVQMIDNWCRSQPPVQIVGGLQGLADYVEPEEETKAEETKETAEPEEKETE